MTGSWNEVLWGQERAFPRMGSLGRPLLAVGVLLLGGAACALLGPIEGLAGDVLRGGVLGVAGWATRGIDVGARTALALAVAGVALSAFGFVLARRVHRVVVGAGAVTLADALGRRTVFEADDVAVTVIPGASPARVAAEGAAVALGLGLLLYLRDGPPPATSALAVFAYVSALRRWRGSPRIAVGTAPRAFRLDPRHFASGLEDALVRAAGGPPAGEPPGRRVRGGERPAAAPG